MGKALIGYTQSTGSASGTFISPMGSGAGNADAVDTEYAATTSTVFSNLRRWISSGGSGSNTLQFQKNSESGNLVVTATGTGEEVDAVNTDTLVSGDVFNLALTDDGSDPIYRWVSANVELSPVHGCYHRCGSTTGVVFDLASTTSYFPFSGQLSADGDTTEANQQWKNRGYTSLSAFQVRISANARTTDATFVVRLNGADVAASSITVPAGATGLFLVTDIGQVLADGDLINGAVTLSTGVEDLTVDFVGVTLLSSAGSSEAWMAAANGTTRTASGTPSFYFPGGIGAVFNGAGNRAVTAGFAADCENLRIYLSANTYSGAATVTLYVDGVASDVTFSIPAGETGWFEDTTNKATITATSTVSMSIDEGTSGSITIQSFGFTFNTVSEVDPSVDVSRRFSGGSGIGIGARNWNHPWPSFSLVGG